MVFAGLSLLLNFLKDLFTDNGKLLRRLNTQPNASTAHAYNSDRDGIANANTLTNLAAKDQHVFNSCGSTRPTRFRKGTEGEDTVRDYYHNIDAFATMGACRRHVNRREVADSSDLTVASRYSSNREV